VRPFWRTTRQGDSAHDAETQVVVPMVEATSYLHPLATRAGQRVGVPVASFIERAQRDAYRFVVTPKGEGGEDAAGENANWLATTAAKLGYSTRACEFQDELLRDIPETNEHLTHALERSYRERTHGADWFAALCGTAAMVMAIARTEPYSADAAELLAPAGFGHDAHVGLCSWLINGLRASPQAQHRVAAEGGGITDPELSDCWMYGYYLRACEIALPDQARQEFAETESR
jgi:hypothetical protein